ncbi:2-succinyl-5-enolpyruvyl-6-hydroxy-3-cyclohexene-1-carboxylic-acid synthase [Vibrio sp. F74]|uniref:2-succinyl-5-enolpyruvyl-6-hydroxy-3- cyclohexene-1-carboxylic-acid synthase n=1 Tax=Vibrio sp. F74 TaxID=700020 RepID=UPI0035F59BCD
MSQNTLSRQTDQAVLNRIWSEVMLEELVRLGVHHVCIAPGSRSTPLTLEADSNPELTIHTHFDERGLGFLALGMAKASLSPVAIIVTSGTAVANLLPAIAEAKLTGEKLVVLTADRPPELIDCGANQAINQVGIYSSHVNGSLNLPSPTENIPITWLLSSVDNLMHQQKRTGGAVHINCPFPEPLYSDVGKSIYDDYLLSVDAWKSKDTPYTRQIRRDGRDINDMISLQTHKGLVVIGNVDVADAEKAKALAIALGWPVLCDPQSGLSSEWQHYDLWLRTTNGKTKLEQCDLILQFGSRLVSKTLNEFIKKQCTHYAAKYYLIDNEETRSNPDHLPQTHICSCIVAWVNEQLLLKLPLISRHKSWADELKLCASQAKNLALECDEFSELGVAIAIPKIVGKKDLFIGNSLVVRLLDMVTALLGNRAYTNRGASGIDGLVATAAGVQRINKEAMLALLGDTSLLYDLNSLSLFSHTIEPIIILVTNNDGGAIFDLLPVPQEKKTALYQMPHGYRFKYAAKQFGLKYLDPDNMNELIGVATEHLDSGKGALLIEMRTPSGQASDDIKNLIQRIHAAH